jgi:hypothetical protein
MVVIVKKKLRGVFVLFVFNLHACVPVPGRKKTTQREGVHCPLCVVCAQSSRAAPSCFTTAIRGETSYFFLVLHGFQYDLQRPSQCFCFFFFTIPVERIPVHRPSN